MFVQGGRPCSASELALGIGLALARRIAELHGGSLSAASDGEGKGAEFTLRIPLSRSGQPSVRGTAQLEVPPQRALMPRRILVVDDNADAAKTLELLLKSLGHDTRAVFDGIEALRVASEFRPDVVLLDIGMPGLDGYEVAKRLRRLEKKPLRIVAVTRCRAPPGCRQAPVGRGGLRPASREAGSCGEFATMSAPSRVIRRTTSGACMARRASAFSLATISPGTRAGANMPNHARTSYPGTPLSATVGSSGKNLLRVLLVTASAFRRPALTSGSADVGKPSIQFTSPEATAG